MQAQLDFIGTPKIERGAEQFNLWDSKGKPTKVQSDIDFAKVDALFNSFDSEEVEQYKSYWESIKPKNDTEVFQRWLFAFMSVHTSWESNVRGYEAVKDWTKWVNRDDELERLLVESRVGLHKNRTRFISQFAQKFGVTPNGTSIKRVAGKHFEIDLSRAFLALELQRFRSGLK